ncbi:FAD-dependent oxidoreductase [Mycolicibacterium sp.]|uniref:NAD(P)/FAD-dependent oxidoreductase n=1 Tax=Mycolicibacterium sp. TaxID=2320850 RepID=UPI0025CC0054|nr:FAD-dependent oxidoreductase [Mycolicibacterium sp.]
MAKNGVVSHWFSSLPAPRRALPGDREADVCIVGAGYTGLWTAYYLKQLDPALRITVLEARFAGFGASGRNGGWLSGLPPGHRGLLAAEHGRDAVITWQRMLNEAVDEVIEVARREGIAADIVKGGNLEVARNRAQAERLREEFDEDRRWGVDDVELLTAHEAAARVNVDSLVLGSFNPHCARVQPAKLARGLADVVERLGVTVYEQTRVTAIGPGRADTPLGSVRAPVILRATEGFTARMRGLRRRWLPMNSAMIATEPLPQHVWDDIGWQGCELLGDLAHGFFYAQRTADGRIAIGGRANPYRFGSRIDRDGVVGQDTIDYLTGNLNTVLPQTRGVPIAHGWCGVLAVPRDWTAGVEYDPKTGLGEAGGYVGHGVTATNLAGRTLADLVLKRHTDLTVLPWVGHHSRTWEPEPLRWLGVRGLYTAYKAADRHEGGARKSTSPIAKLADRITGRP